MFLFASYSSKERLFVFGLAFMFGNGKKISALSLLAVSAMLIVWMGCGTTSTFG